MALLSRLAVQSLSATLRLAFVILKPVFGYRCAILTHSCAEEEQTCVFGADIRLPIPDLLVYGLAQVTHMGEKFRVRYFMIQARSFERPSNSVEKALPVIQ